MGCRRRPSGRRSGGSRKRKSCTGRGRTEGLKSTVSKLRELKKLRFLTKADSGIS